MDLASKCNRLLHLLVFFAPLGFLRWFVGPVDLPGFHRLLPQFIVHVEALWPHVAVCLVLEDAALLDLCVAIPALEL